MTPQHSSFRKPAANTWILFRKTRTNSTSFLHFSPKTLQFARAIRLTGLTLAPDSLSARSLTTEHSVRPGRSHGVSLNLFELFVYRLLPRWHLNRDVAVLDAARVVALDVKRSGLAFIRVQSTACDAVDFFVVDHRDAIGDLGHDASY